MCTPSWDGWRPSTIASTIARAISVSRNAILTYEGLIYSDVTILPTVLGAPLSSIRCNWTAAGDGPSSASFRHGSLLRKTREPRDADYYLIMVDLIL